MTAGNVEFSMSTGGVLVKFLNELLKFTTIIQGVDPSQLWENGKN